jgi:hypothetical protein
VNIAMKETTNVRRLEFLNAMANPIDIEIMGKEGRAAVLREVAKSLQMPGDEVVPSQEKTTFSGRMAAKLAQQQPQQAQPTMPDGAPKGGMEANMVQNRSSGRAA